MRLVDPGAALVRPGKRLVDPGAALVNPGKALVKPGKRLVDPGGALVKPGGVLVFIRGAGLSAARTVRTIVRAHKNKVFFIPEYHPIIRLALVYRNGLNPRQLRGLQLCHQLVTAPESPYVCAYLGKHLSSSRAGCDREPAVRHRQVAVSFPAFV